MKTRPGALIQFKGCGGFAPNGIELHPLLGLGFP